jgi:WD40 repeat protein
MTGHVFVSYGRGDREIAHRLARELDSAGFTVWWDRDIDIGVPYDRVIERALVDASCVVVLWSADSIESDWVRAEADEGRRRGILVPALIEPVAPPLQFRLLETVDLSGWTDGVTSPAFDRFRTAVARLSSPTDWLSRWREGLATHGLLQTVPLAPHDGWVSSVRFVDDAEAVSTGGDGVIRSWALPRGSAGPSARGHDGSVWCCAVDGDVLATGGADRTLRIWDTHTLEPVRVLEGHTEWVLGCGVSCRSGLLASSSRDASVRVWDLKNGNERVVLTGHRGPVWAASFNADGDRLVTSSDDQTVRVWAVPGGREVSTLRGHTGPVTACVPLPDGERVISGGYDGVVHCWDLGSGASVGRLEGEGDWVLSLTVTPDGALAIGGTRTGLILVWDLATFEVVARLGHHRGPVMSLDFRSGLGLLSGSADKTAVLLRLRPFDLE